MLADFPVFFPCGLFRSSNIRGVFLFTDVMPAVHFKNTLTFRDPLEDREMVLDLEVVRTEPERVRENQRKRFSDESLVDTVLQFDNLWKKGNALKKIQFLEIELSIVRWCNGIAANIWRIFKKDFILLKFFLVLFSSLKTYIFQFYCGDLFARLDSAS